MPRPVLLPAALALLALAALDRAATAQIARQGDRLVDTSKPAVERTVTDGTDLQADDRRAILDIVARLLGTEAVASSGRNLPDAVEAAIVEGDPLPEGAKPSPVAGPLADALAPWRPEGTTWVRAGEHLIAADGRGVAVIVLYDALD